MKEDEAGGSWWPALVRRPSQWLLGGCLKTPSLPTIVSSGSAQLNPPKYSSTSTSTSTQATQATQAPRVRKYLSS